MKNSATLTRLLSSARPYNEIFDFYRHEQIDKQSTTTITVTFASQPRHRVTVSKSGSWEANYNLLADEMIGANSISVTQVPNSEWRRRFRQQLFNDWLDTEVSPGKPYPPDPRSAAFIIDESSNYPSRETTLGIHVK